MSKFRCSYYAAAISMMIGMAASETVAGIMAEPPQSGGEAMIFNERSFELHGKDGETVIVDDPLAENGKSVRMMENLNGWLLQWVWPSSEFPRNIVYKLYIKARPANPNAGLINLSGGIYYRSTIGKGVVFSQFNERAPIPPGSTALWRYIPVGESRLDNVYGYVYVLTGSEPVLIDSIVAVPVVDDSNKALYSLALNERKEKTASNQRELSAIKANTREYPRIGKTFLFGAVTAKTAFLKSAAITGVPWEWEFKRILRDLKRHYCNFNYILALDAAHYECYPAVKIMEEEAVFSVAGDVKAIPSIFKMDYVFDRAKFRSFFEAEIPRYERFNHFMAWSLADEPVPSKVYEYIVAKDIVESIDKKRPAIPILNTEEVIRLYAPYQQIVVTDYYTIRSSAPDPWAVGSMVKLCRDYGPVCLMWGAYSNKDSMRMPSRVEARVMIWQGLVNNAVWFASYIHNFPPEFSYGVSHADTLADSLGNSSAVWDEVELIAKRLVPAGKIIAGSTYITDGPFKAGPEKLMTPSGELPVIQTAAWKHNGAWVLMILNNDTNNARSANVNITDDKIASLPGINMMTCGKINPESAVINTRLQPGDAIIMAFGGNETLCAIKDSVLQNKLEQERAILECDAELLEKYHIPAEMIKEKIKKLPASLELDNEAAAIKAEIHWKLQATVGFIDKQKALSASQIVLGECESMLEKIAAKKGAAPKDLTDKWLGQAAVFGALRFKLLEGLSEERERYESCLADSKKLLREISAVRGN